MADNMLEVPSKFEVAAYTYQKLYEKSKAREARLMPLAEVGRLFLALPPNAVVYFDTQGGLQGAPYELAGACAKAREEKDAPQ